MITNTIALLETFDELSHDEQLVVAAADELFVVLDQEEATRI